MAGAVHNVDALLLFPPSRELYTMPEIGLPRLAAYLRATGHTVAHEDWNLLYWNDFLFKKTPFQHFLTALQRDFQVDERCFFQPVHELFRRFLSRGLAGDRATRDFVFENRREIFAWLYEETKIEDFSKTNVLRLVASPDPLLDNFIAWRVCELLGTLRPRLVGLSVISAQQLVATLKIARALRRLVPETTIVIGGPWAKVGVERLATERYAFLFDDVDAIVVSDGEFPLRDMLAADGRPDPATAPNVLYRDGQGALRRTDVAEVPALDELPPPDFSDLPLNLYADLMIPVERASMCYWRKCAFCWHNHKDRRWNQLTPEAVVERIADYRERLRTDRFTFIDNAVDAEYSGRIADLLLERGLGIEWGMQARFDRAFLDPAYCQKLADSGCRMIFFGLETVQRHYLKAFRKGIDIDAVPAILANLDEAGVASNLYLMLYPGQSRDDLEETLRYCLAQRDHVSVVVIQRFLLNGHCLAHDKPDLLGLRVMPDEDPTLDFYDLPYESEGCVHDDAYFARVTDQFFRLMRSTTPLPLDAAPSIDELFRQAFPEG